jgi:hypothetical protein
MIKKEAAPAADKPTTSPVDTDGEGGDDGGGAGRRGGRVMSKAPILYLT